MDVDSEHKTTYLSCMSHEIRSILSIIMGACDMAKRHINDEEKVDEFLNRISSNACRIVTITDKLMAAGKDASENENAECESFFIDELADELRKLMEPIAEEKGIQFNMILRNVPSVRISSDYGRLLHMMINIISNAIKYTPAGGLVKVIFEETDCDNDGLTCCHFSCHDTGIGMPAEFLEHIFEPYARADDERIATISGKGLGMMIVKEIVETLGGRIHIDSILNEGTKVTVDLKLPSADRGQTFI